MVQVCVRIFLTLVVCVKGSFGREIKKGFFSRAEYLGGCVVFWVVIEIAVDHFVLSGIFFSVAARPLIDGWRSVAPRGLVHIYTASQWSLFSGKVGFGGCNL